MALVCGVGINDCPGWATTRLSGRWEFRVYRLWHAMLSRCYMSKEGIYEGCTVCERWLTLSNFAEDIERLPGYGLWRDNPGKKISLDKDIRIFGNKEYSPDACSFVTVQQNIYEEITRHNLQGTGIHSSDAQRKSRAKSISISIKNTRTGEEILVASAVEAGKIVGLADSSISRIVRGKQPQKEGFIIERVDL